MNELEQYISSYFGVINPNEIDQINKLFKQKTLATSKVTREKIIHKKRMNL